MKRHDDRYYYPTDEDIEYSTKVLTLLCHALNPKIDLGQTYALLYPIMSGVGLTEKNVRMLGREINETANNNGPQTQQ